ncbi:hypothetical protein DFR70_111191 [Nocardia tenerifensis]|uniref:Ig-like domain-containing protein n=1 Tax=Nocardia tenerifensis TaxID=228006 RepID=A0A318JYK8_9NOCA|nr:hypothetical protein DFR70_111191 [Nocardia tenerifensis]
MPGESITVEVTLEPGPSGRLPAVRIQLAAADSPLASATVSRVPKIRNKYAVTSFTSPYPGAYTIQVNGITPGSPITPVSATVLVWSGRR